MKYLLLVFSFLFCGCPTVSKHREPAKDGALTVLQDKSLPELWGGSGKIAVVCVEGYKFVVIGNGSGSDIEVVQMWDRDRLPITCGD